MTAYEEGAVVLARVPFSDQLEHKKRPVVILTRLEDAADAYVVVAVTSNVSSCVEKDVVIKGKEVQTAGLQKESLVKTGFLFCAARGRLDKQLGVLTGSLRRRVHVGVCRQLGCEGK